MQVPRRKGDQRLGQKPDPYLTEAKFKELQAKLIRLKNFSRPQTAAEVRRLALDGDFSENAGYQLVKGRLRGINQRIIDIENHLKEAIIITTDVSSQAVQIGSRVTLEKAGQATVYTILGSTESNPSQRVISYQSPLGAALMGRRAGDRIRLRLTNKEIEYTIIKIEVI